MSRNEALPETLDRQIRRYSVAAAAAGVGIAALAQPATATIVITNKNIPIPLCYSTAPCPVTIDFNNDGIADVELMFTDYPTHSSFSLLLTARKLGAGAGIMSAGQNLYRLPYASCLLRGAKIGSSAQFGSAVTVERSSGGLYGTHYRFGKWGGNHPNRFMGVKFQIHGKTHYGWIRITVNTTSLMTATITEYGYETVANKAVSAGLPGAAWVQSRTSARPSAPSLGALALGVEGLAIWRRDEESSFAN